MVIRCMESPSPLPKTSCYAPPCTGRPEPPCYPDSSSHARPASNPSLEPAPAVLQRSGDGRISPALGALARAERLLRHGEAAGRVSQRSPELQSGAVADYADSGLRCRDGAGSVSECSRQAGEGFDAERAAVCPAVSVSGQPRELDRTLPSLPRVVGEIPGAW